MPPTAAPNTCLPSGSPEDGLSRPRAFYRNKMHYICMNDLVSSWKRNLRGYLVQLLQNKPYYHTKPFGKFTNNFFSV